jgi:transcriptional regulator with XRE-family HTH domain
VDPRDARTVLANYVRTRLKKEEQERGRGYQADVARRTGLSTAHVANIMNRPHQGLGIEAMTALAGYWGITLGQLEEAAKEWAKNEPAPSSRALTQPNLVAALDFVRTREPVPDDVVETAVRVGVAGGDFSPQVWIALLHDLLTMRAHKEKAPAPELPPRPHRRKRPAL